MSDILSTGVDRAHTSTNLQVRQAPERPQKIGPCWVLAVGLSLHPNLDLSGSHPGATLHGTLRGSSPRTLSGRDMENAGSTEQSRKQFTWSNSPPLEIQGHGGLEARRMQTQTCPVVHSSLQSYWKTSPLRNVVLPNKLGAWRDGVPGITPGSKWAGSHHSTRPLGLVSLIPAATPSCLWRHGV